MAAVHRAIFVWFWLLIFVILLVLRLDGRVSMNYFVVFLPMWVLDSAFFGASLVRFTQTIKSRPRTTGSNNNSNSVAVAAHGTKLRRALGAALITVFALAFQILLCIKAEYGNEGNFAESLAWYYVMIPFWLLLSVVLVDLTYRLVFIYRQ